MALLSSGAISANAINLEIGVSGTTTLSLGSNNVRMLAGQSSGSTSAIDFNSFYSKTYADGSTSAKAASSARYIKNLTGTTTNGVYWINLPTAGPTQTYCIMDPAYDGGGWMMNVLVHYPVRNSHSLITFSSLKNQNWISIWDIFRMTEANLKIAK